MQDFLKARRPILQSNDYRCVIFLNNNFDTNKSPLVLTTYMNFILVRLSLSLILYTPEEKLMYQQTLMSHDRK